MDKQKSMSDLGPLIEEFIENGRKVRITVTGCSMRPLIENKKDSVLIEKCTNPEKYDIILYKRSNGQYVLHRIVGKKDNAFVLTGDFEDKKEYGIKKEQIIAGVTHIYKKDGRKINCRGKKYKLFCALWVAFYPVRKLLFKLKLLR